MHNPAYIYSHTHTYTGLGTGIAPLMGFLAHRRALQDMGTPVGPACLFVGCRDVYSDFLYKDELLEFVRGINTLVLCVCVCVCIHLYSLCVCMYSFMLFVCMYVFMYTRIFRFLV